MSRLGPQLLELELMLQHLVEPGVGLRLFLGPCDTQLLTLFLHGGIENDYFVSGFLVKFQRLGILVADHGIAQALPGRGQPRVSGSRALEQAAGTVRVPLEQDLFGQSQDVHTWHHLGLWVIVSFVIVHIYAAVREDIMSRQSMVSTMISGHRTFKDDLPD